MKPEYEDKQLVAERGNTLEKRREDSAVAKAIEQKNIAELTAKWLLLMKEMSC